MDNYIYIHVQGFNYNFSLSILLYNLFLKNFPNSKPKNSIYTFQNGLQIILEHYIRGGLTQELSRHIPRKDLNINVMIKINGLWKPDKRHQLAK